MSETPSNLNDEIDLITVKRQVKNLASFVYIAFSFIIRYIKRFSLLTGALLGVSVFLFVYTYRYSRLYESKASFIYTDLNKKVFGEMTDQLQGLIKSGDYKEVGRYLNMDEKDAHFIKAITARGLNGAKLSEDVNNAEKVFYITVKTENNAILPGLERNIEYYLNNNVLAKDIVAKNIERYKKIIAYDQEEIKRLDSLKLTYTNTFGKASSPVNAITNPFNPVELYEKSEKLNEQVAQLQALVKDYKIVEAQNIFMPDSKPSVSVAALALKYFLFFIVVTGFIIFCISIFKHGKAAA